MKCDGIADAGRSRIKLIFRDRITPNDVLLQTGHANEVKRSSAPQGMRFGEVDGVDAHAASCSTPTA